MDFKKRIELVERIDRLIRLNATGTPNQLADRLNLSKRQLYRVIGFMKELEAPIVYRIGRGCYEYEKPVQFRFGFYGRELSVEEQQNFNGGYNNFSRIIELFS